MYKLVDLPDVVLAETLVAHLRDANIPATCLIDLTVRGGFKSGMTTVYLERASDSLAAVRVLDNFNREVAELTTEMQCGGCGYDLRGHNGEGVCPECGLPIKASPAEIPCPHCGELVPADFDACWNCGRSISGLSRTSEL